MRRKVISLTVGLAAGLCAWAGPAFADRMKLWALVHGECVPRIQAGAPPEPCDSVDLSGGVALLKDRDGVAQMLAIPTRRVTGIEDPQVLGADAPNYFAAAWAGRARLEAHLGRPAPREAVGLSINSMVSRSQDQLHIHINCMRPDVAAALAAYQGSLDTQWRPMSIELQGRHYWARRLDSEDLSADSPFLLLAEGVAGAKADFGLWTILAAGANFDGKPGFILLVDHAELSAGGHAEDLQDQDCAIVPLKP
jgi:CDP-diacylglycerol pyrophosphatase